MFSRIVRPFFTIGCVLACLACFEGGTLSIDGGMTGVGNDTRDASSVYHPQQRPDGDDVEPGEEETTPRDDDPRDDDPVDDRIEPEVGVTATCECAMAKRIFELYNEDRVAHGLEEVRWDEGTARLTTEAARVMAFETGFRHSGVEMGGLCSRVVGGSGSGTFCYVTEERISLNRCRWNPPCTFDQVVEALYQGVMQYPSRYNAGYTYYSVGVYFDGETYWMTEWMNTGPSLPNGGQCFRCHCPGEEADQVLVEYDPDDTENFCPHWIDPIWDANRVDYPECETPHYDELFGNVECDEQSPPLG